MSDPLASAASNSHIIEEAAKFKWDGNSVEPGIGLALSGGGFRAMLFHAGALLRLNEFGVLSRIDRISSVSGGSIAAGYLACIWAKLGKPDASGTFDQFQNIYVEPIVAFSRQKIDVTDILMGMLPWHCTSDMVAVSYERLLFGPMTLQDIPDKPTFVFCATNLQTGVLWRFSKPYAGDYIVGRLDKPNVQLSHAVAASSAFPPFLSPMALVLPDGSFTNWPGQDAAGAGIIDPAPLRARILLSDGGVYDNHGLEPLVKRYMTILVSDGGAPFARVPEVNVDPIRQLQRVFDVTDNQVRALRRRDLIARFQAAGTAQASGKLGPTQTDPYGRFGTYWGIDTDPAKLQPLKALPCKPDFVDQLAHLSTRLSDLGEAQSKQLINWGYAICDRCVRIHYDVPELSDKPDPKWPYPDNAIG
jgi:NTE family protein